MLAQLLLSLNSLIIVQQAKANAADSTKPPSVPKKPGATGVDGGGSDQPLSSPLLFPTPLKSSSGGVGQNQNVTKPPTSTDSGPSSNVPQQRAVNSPEEVTSASKEDPLKQSSGLKGSKSSISGEVKQDDGYENIPVKETTGAKGAKSASGEVIGSSQSVLSSSHEHSTVPESSVEEESSQADSAKSIVFLISQNIKGKKDKTVKSVDGIVIDEDMNQVDTIFCFSEGTGPKEYLDDLKNFSKKITIEIADISEMCKQVPSFKKATFVYEDEYKTISELQLTADEVNKIFKDAVEKNKKLLVEAVEELGKVVITPEFAKIKEDFIKVANSPDNQVTLATLEALKNGIRIEAVKKLKEAAAATTDSAAPATTTPASTEPNIIEIQSTRLLQSLNRLISLQDEKKKKMLLSLKQKDTNTENPLIDFLKKNDNKVFRFCFEEGSNNNLVYSQAYKLNKTTNELEEVPKTFGTVKQKPWYTKPTFIIVIVLVAIVAIGLIAFLLLRSKDSESDD
ncbi:hypothetical protein CDIK_2000 [Cucumispora dikerogammari]|nr:hypothetical protein CDIK_2000 [Cucumispora dikerogammari]